MDQSILKRIAEKIYAFSRIFVLWAGLLLLCVLFLAAFFVTGYAQDMETQKVLFRTDNLLLNAMGILLLFFLFAKITIMICRKPDKRKKQLLILVLIFQGIGGLILVLFGRTVPAADSMSVYSIAESLALGNMGVIHPSDSYLSYYPQQMGLVAYYEVLIRILKIFPQTVAAFHFIKCINVFWALALIFFQYKVVHILFEDDKTDCFFLLFSVMNFPLLFYTSFVYGEVPAFALFVMGLTALLRLMQKPGRHKWLYMILSVAAFTASTMLRKNTLVLMIAVLLVSVLQVIRYRQRILLIFCLLCTTGVFGILPLTTAVYEYRAENTLSCGVPAISYLAMGMQESSRAEGWYNGFNFQTWKESGLDKSEATKVSKEAIHKRLEEFRENPGYAIGFYCNKFLSQWTDGTYAYRQATLADYGGRSTFFQEVYDGAYSKYVIEIGNLYQNLLHLGAFLFCLLMVTKRIHPSVDGLPLYVGLVGVMGGFLFHMIWEANARYIFPYGLLLVPYAANGLAAAAGYLPLRKSSVAEESRK